MDKHGKALISGATLASNSLTKHNEIIACVTKDNKAVITGATGSLNRVAVSPGSKPPPDSKCPPVPTSHVPGQKNADDGSTKAAAGEKPIITTTNTMLGSPNAVNVNSMTQSKNCDEKSSPTVVTPANTPEMLEGASTKVVNHKQLIDKAAAQLSENTHNVVDQAIKDGINRQTQRTQVIQIHDVFHGDEENPVERALKESGGKASAAVNVVEDTIIRSQNKDNVVDAAIKQNQKKETGASNPVDNAVIQSSQQNITNVVEEAIRDKTQPNDQTANHVHEAILQNQIQQNVVADTIRQNQLHDTPVNPVEQTFTQNKFNVVDATIRENVQESSAAVNHIQEAIKQHDYQESHINPVNQALTQTKTNVVDSAIKDGVQHTTAARNYVEDTINSNQPKQNVVDEAIKRSALQDTYINPVTQAITQSHVNVIDATIKAKQSDETVPNPVLDTIVQNQSNVVDQSIKKNQLSSGNINPVQSAISSNQKNVVDAAVKENQQRDTVLNSVESTVIQSKKTAEATMTRLSSTSTEVKNAAKDVTVSIVTKSITKTDSIKQKIQQDVADVTVVSQSVAMNEQNVVEDAIKHNVSKVRTPNVVEETITAAARLQKQTMAKDKSLSPPRIVESVDLTMVKSGATKASTNIVESVELQFEKLGTQGQENTSGSNGHVIVYHQTESERNADRKLDDAMKDMEMKILASGTPAEEPKTSLKDIPKFPSVNREEEEAVERHSQVMSRSDFDRADDTRSSRTWPRPSNNVTEQAEAPHEPPKNGNGRPRAASESAKDTIQPVPPSTFKRFRTYVRERCTIL